MNTLLIFFALPIAVIIISVILQKLFSNPIAVAALTFAIFLVVTFAVGNTMLLIATLAYTILSLITALIVRFICDSSNHNICELLNRLVANSNNNNGTNLSNILSNNDTNNDEDTNNTNSCGCRYKRYRRF